MTRPTFNNKPPETLLIYIYIPLPLVQFQMSPSDLLDHWGIRLGDQHKNLIFQKWFSGLQRNKLSQTIVRCIGKASHARFIYVCFFIPYWLWRVGLVKPWFAFWYTFWCRVIQSLLDFGVITKETLLSFETPPSDPKRAIGPAQVLRGSCWVRSKIREVGPVEPVT